MGVVCAYDPIPYLPALKGKSFSDALLTSRFRQDYRKTVSDLWIDGHYRASTKFLNSYGMKLVAEGGHGGYPRVEPLKAMGVVDIPRGEFWNGQQFWVVKEAASAAHIYGLQVVDSESFTGWRSWQDGPLEYKRLADTAFCDGLNRITFHTFAHTPPSGGVPGNMYHAGEHFNVNVTWWNQSGPMLAYFSRCCYMLQQGLPVGDVCYYYGDVAPNLVATRRIGPDSKRLDGAKCAHCGRPNPAPADALGTGYDYEVIDSEVIQDRLQIKDGRLVLPHGVSYEALVLPPHEEMPLDKLVSWTEMPDDGIKYFSGTATYLKNFEVSEAWIKGDLRGELSLGELRNVAEVTVNGKPLGILWKPPYKVDVTGLLKPGKNELKIDITNLWANRIAGDEKLPREKRVTRITQKLSVPGPHPSGLFGPVQLLLTQ